MTGITHTYKAEEVFNPYDSVFVSANAGAGKTSLLTNRVLSLLLHGVPPAKILCLTFTKAATAEMANRVQKELGKWVMADDAKLATALTGLNHAADARTMARARALFAQVLESPEGVRIETLHGLCQSILRRFPLEAGVSPHFTVMDERTEQEVMHEASQRLFARAQTEDPALLAALQAISRQHGEDALHELMQAVIRQRRAIKRLFARLGEDAATARVWELMGLAKDCTLAALLERHFTYSESELAALRGIAARQQQGQPKRDDARVGAALALWLENRHDRESCIETYLNAFITQKGTPYAKLHNAGTLDDALAECLAAEQQRALAFHDTLNAHNIATRTGHMLRIAEALLALYAQLKTSRALMDYEDLIIHANELLKKQQVIPWVLYKLDGGIDHLLVDEAQDTSPEQWAIVDALTEEFFAGQGRGEQARSIFVVGDEKQSIYSFQGADPREFGKARQRYKTRVQDAGKRAHVISLTRSFRSSTEVLSAVDAVFAQSAASEGLTFSGEPFNHIPTRKGAPGIVEIWPPFLPPDKDQESNEPRAVIKLARAIADSIQAWLHDGLMLESEQRPVRPGDIMVLVRKRSPLVDPLVRALKKRGVPVAGHDRMELSENLAVQDLIALGQCLLLPEDSLTLAGLLKSPLFALSEHELFQLAHGREKQSLWERLQAMQALSPATQAAHDLLVDLRARADFIAPYELYSYLLEDCGGRNRMAGRMGDEYHEPLDEFLNLALLYERSHTPSLQGFIHWLGMSESQIKRDMEQAQSCVRILTVHASKGLEAPIVILPDITQRNQGGKDVFLWHEEDGLRFPFWVGGGRHDDPFCARLRQRRADEQAAEYRRLLYVALTRARDRLYICGASDLKQMKEQAWYHLVQTGLAPLATPFALPWGEGLRLGAPAAVRSAATPEEQPRAQETSAFAYLLQPPPSEPVPPQPLAPSRLAGEEPAAASPLEGKALYRRGTLIHQLLQYLPQAAEEKRQALAQKLCAPYAMPPDEAQAAIEETLRIIAAPQYAHLFGPAALAEVPVAGLVDVNGKPVAVSGQIDRLYIGEDGIWVVDFKSNHTPPPPNRIPSAYLRQMRLYQLLLQKIYPGKQVRCALLWTASCAITELGQSLLDEVPASTYI